MIRLTLAVLLIAAGLIESALAVELPIGIESQDRSTPVDFDTEIMPLLGEIASPATTQKKQKGV